MTPKEYRLQRQATKKNKSTRSLDDLGNYNYDSSKYYAQRAARQAQLGMRQNNVWEALKNVVRPSLFLNSVSAHVQFGSKTVDSE